MEYHLIESNKQVKNSRSVISKELGSSFVIGGSSRIFEPAPNAEFRAVRDIALRVLFRTTQRVLFRTTLALLRAK